MAIVLMSETAAGKKSDLRLIEDAK